MRQRERERRVDVWGAGVFLMQDRNGGKRGDRPKLKHNLLSVLFLVHNTCFYLSSVTKF